MKNTLTLFLFLLVTSWQLSAQQVEDVVNGLSNPFGLALYEGELYLSSQNTTGGSAFAGQITKINPAMANPTPEIVSQVEFSTSMVVHDGFLYVTDISSIQRIDLSAATPSAENVLTDLGFPNGLLVIGDELYFCQTATGSVDKIDLNQASPTVTPVVTQGLSGPIALEHRDGILYIAESDNEEVSTVNLGESNPMPTPVASGLPGILDITFDGDYLYAAIQDDLVRFNPSTDSPVEVFISNLDAPHGLLFVDGVLHVTEYAQGKVIKITQITPAWSAPDPICASVDNIVLGGASPTGGVYSGDGVTDNGDGLSFTFDATTLTPGNNTVTYTNDGLSVSVEIEVIASPDVTFMPPGPFDINDGIQPLSGGMPEGGAYSGQGVVDNGDGTYAFDPSTGAGTYTVTYTYEDGNGCTGDATADIEVTAVPTTFELTIDTLCLPIAGGIATNLGGGLPEGGVYSGDGVTDDGNGMTFSLDVFAASYPEEITYTVNGQSAVDTLFGLRRDFAFNYFVNGPTIEFFSHTFIDLVGATTTYDFGDGSATVTQPASSSPPSHTYEQVGTYEVCGTQVVFEGCDSTFCQTIVIEPFLDGDVCTDAIDINAQFGQAAGVVQSSGPYDNTNATTDNSDPDFGWECFGEPDGGGNAPSLERTLWFTFEGDGNSYFIEALACGEDPIDFGDTQFAIYSGSDCSSLEAVLCSEDGPNAMAGGPFPAGDTLQTEAGVTYFLMVDGFGPEFPADGEFCVEVTNLTAVPAIIFQVDASRLVEAGTLSAEGIFLAGEFNGWSNPGTLMSEGTDNVWSITVNLQPGAYEYKFQNGPDGWENIDTSIGDNCTVGDTGNRQVTVGDMDFTTDLVCFNYCVSCDLVVGIDEWTLRNSIEVFPNPVQDILNVQIDLPEATETLNIQLLNTLGQVVLSGNYRELQRDNIELDMSQLPSGTYLLQVRDGQALFARPVIVQR